MDLRRKEQILKYCLLGFMSLALILVLWAAVHDRKSEKIVLRKSQWTCTSWRNKDSTQIQMIGEVPVPTKVSTFVCDAWKRKPE